MSKLLPSRWDMPIGYFPLSGQIIAGIREAHIISAPHVRWPFDPPIIYIFGRCV